MQMDSERYEAAPQFSNTTGIPTSTLAKLRMRGGGPPYVKIGRAVRYPVRAGLEWMAARTIRNTSETLGVQPKARIAARPHAP
jgi:predicted DNA-binding transcriptional regulator AlpA